jgi:hypothetical protein
MLTVTAQNLAPEADATEQLSMFSADLDAKAKRAEKIEKAMDAIRGKYGVHSIQPGIILNNDLGISDNDDNSGEE